MFAVASRLSGGVDAKTRGECRVGPYPYRLGFVTGLVPVIRAVPPISPMRFCTISVAYRAGDDPTARPLNRVDGRERPGHDGPLGLFRAHSPGSQPIPAPMPSGRRSSST